jgi:hypothetical protein
MSVFRTSIPYPTTQYHVPVQRPGKAKLEEGRGEEGLASADRSQQSP